ncbi:alpha-N-acetylgalactosaminide alpha-2,6-sialyltransferase 5 isoform X2 [Rhipicephalus microplus]|uniref:alpha-N-acetylgalactosaminide alpha-2,6-sialyltransferase 5 isoform X2 n=1 Tax=Rhipicephalus microplus TaxID=6941 RepID=UPI003F6D0995
MVRLCRRCLVPAVLVLACLLCTLQMLAALVGTAEDTKRVQAQKAHRLRPRHVGGEPDVRGRTYQRHMAEPLDARHRELHSERLRLNRLFRPHLVARRQIFSHLLNSAMGDKVDASDCVIRLGRSPGRGYDGDVGSKTTFRLMHADMLLELVKGPTREKRLANGPLASDYIVVFGTPKKATTASLRTRFQSSRAPFLLSLRRSTEHAAAKSMAQHASTLGYQLSGAEPSTLWHAVKLVETLGCQSLKVFGVPEPKLCKRQRDEPSRSRFWEYSSPPQCTDGVDVGHNEDPLKPDPAHLSLVDRRAMAGWLQSAKRLDVRFLAPTWSVFKHASSAT